MNWLKWALWRVVDPVLDYYCSVFAQIEAECERRELLTGRRRL